MIDCASDNAGGETGWLMAGCKLNLFLHINGRRPDGFHELQTYFQLLEYGDELNVRPDRSGQIRVTWIAGAEDTDGQPARAEDDLLYRAAMALKEAAVESGRLSPASAARLGADIMLRKNIPVGGGLGGGSASAGCLLNRLNRLWNLALTPGELEAVAVRLGADVPVFIRARSAVAHGIGERTRSTEVPEGPQEYLVLVPDMPAHTASLYSDPGLRRDFPKQDDDHVLEHWREAENAFEPIVTRAHPALTALLRDLHVQAGFARMTGSGACLFAPVDSREQGERIGHDLAERHPALRRFFISPVAKPENQPVSEPRANRSKKTG
ncbi:4-(cytidine 5'-diphospho)-2-C-methyl-D-erythritol kinase [Guyparkeria sp.]|uniref:4-(cytidine 5'-diphospho)-2-C-methyl-D-erythritol kinase n=1 Tax=Guyparkeria sp. TaxID=2035736 RepID=UPI0035682D78